MASWVRKSFGTIPRITPNISSWIESAVFKKMPWIKGFKSAHIGF
jgi:hypothetical protein